MITDVALVIYAVATGPEIAADALAGLVGAPAVMTIGGTVIVGMAVDWGSDKIKKVIIEKPND